MIELNINIKIYKYKIGQEFIIKNSNILGKIIKIASIDEFGCDFSFTEKNYVVDLSNCNESIATYNIFKNSKLNYIMNERDLDNKCTFN